MTRAIGGPVMPSPVTLARCEYVIAARSLPGNRALLDALNAAREEEDVE